MEPLMEKGPYFMANRKQKRRTRLWTTHDLPKQASQWLTPPNQTPFPKAPTTSPNSRHQLGTKCSKYEFVGYVSLSIPNSIQNGSVLKFGSICSTWVNFIGWQKLTSLDANLLLIRIANVSATGRITLLLWKCCLFDLLMNTKDAQNKFQQKIDGNVTLKEKKTAKLLSEESEEGVFRTLKQTKTYDLYGTNLNEW